MRTDELEQTFGEIASWQRMLDRHGEVFIEMRPGSRIGIVPRGASGDLPVKDASMMTWQMLDGGVSVCIGRFSGMSSAQVDLLLVADADGMAAMMAALEGDILAVIRRLVRRGSLMFFVFRTRGQLQDAGYDDFLDSFGLAFPGACR